MSRFQLNWQDSELISQLRVTLKDHKTQGLSKWSPDNLAKDTFDHLKRYNENFFDEIYLILFSMQPLFSVFQSPIHVVISINLSFPVANKGF